MRLALALKAVEVVEDQVEAIKAVAAFLISGRDNRFIIELR